jgi:integrase
MEQLASVGHYGAKVAVLRRRPGAPLLLRWTDPNTRKRRYRQLTDKVLTKAKAAALELATELYAVREGTTRDPGTTWAQLLDWYVQYWLPLSRPKQAKTDALELRIWRAVLPLHQPVHALPPVILERFKLQRKAGTLNIPDTTLKANCTDRVVGLDLEWLRRVVNLGMKNPAMLITRSPLVQVVIPDTPQPRRPIASDERFDAVRAVADQVGSQGLFGGLLDLVKALGWRVSALCALRLEDVQLERVYKRAESDKEGMAGWVPVSSWLQPRLAALLEARTALDVPGPWLFPKISNPQEHWHGDYAAACLQSAEKTAGVPPLEGGKFHPYRRLWATKRKHLPVVDVAFAGGWKNIETLQRHYQLVSEADVRAVMEVD